MLKCGRICGDEIERCQQSGSAALAAGQRAVPRDAAAYITETPVQRGPKSRGTRFVGRLQPILTSKGRIPLSRIAWSIPAGRSRMSSACCIRVVSHFRFRRLMEELDSTAVFRRLDGSVTHFVDIYHLCQGRRHRGRISRCSAIRAARP